MLLLCVEFINPVNVTMIKSVYRLIFFPQICEIIFVKGKILIFLFSQIIPERHVGGDGSLAELE